MSRFINSPCYDLDKADICIPPVELFTWMVVLTSRYHIIPIITLFPPSRRADITYHTNYNIISAAAPSRYHISYQL